MVQGKVMTDELDFIARIRARTAETDRQRAGVESATPARTISVLVTHDGAAAEELVFDRPPTLADLVARAGTGAYILGVTIDAPSQLAAE